MNLFLSATALVLVMSVTLSDAVAGRLPGSIHDYNYFKYYLLEKMYKQCLGGDYMRKEEREVRQFIGMCINKMSARHPGFKRQNHYQDQTETTEDTRLNASPFYTASLVQRIGDDVFKNKDLASCFFDELKIAVSSEGVVNGNTFIENLANEELIPAHVRELIVAGAKQCQEQSKIDHYLKWGSKHQNFFKALRFFRCVRQVKFDTCLTLDLTRQAKDYDLDALEGENYEDMTEEQKRFFIHSAYANWDKSGLWDV